MAATGRQEQNRPGKHGRKPRSCALISESMKRTLFYVVEPQATFDAVLPSYMSHPKLEYLKRFVKQNDPKEEYKVLACIGSGTYGDVFKAIHRKTMEPVAVKIMKIDLKDDIRSICQEIHTLRECRHPNIVQFYGSYLR
ncbi:hypothetical protein T265_09812 [Opisthorchis viverrini]|uniref:non-specific serine/threonine protein kinase n=1 Tax=Opisthorchis viverrini TaxID=6198 RepID=A0A074Z4F8_OPIVI|nr:hypothetical protein T265_09812 [Opisthorchis viverrini]KER21981.1 hypothetical protein T265_09812 [Opisthorchis viverrini]